ncbi:MAG TPA: DUF3037 domain-containing protein [Paludibacteraceae bacterium]|nr:DUF3037 domain-containing protein [Paludibacteraceae bacterium]
MRGKYFYEYAVIRLFPKVEREEFINIGIILFSKEAKYIGMKYRPDIEQICRTATELDFDLLGNTLKSFSKICNGDQSGGKIAEMDIAERFRWLTAVRSTCIQTSRPHNGFTDNPEKKLDELFAELVM